MSFFEYLQIKGRKAAETVGFLGRWDLVSRDRACLAPSSAHETIFPYIRLLSKEH